MRGRTIFLAVVAVLSLLSATAVAGGHRVVQGTKGGDELNAGAGADRVFARSGDDQVDGGTGNDRIRGGNGDDALFGGDGKDRLRGGQDNDLLDGGDGNDYLNGGGDGRDKDKIVCGDGYDVVVLGRNDVVLVEVTAAGDAVEGDDGCEQVKRPGGEVETCASRSSACEHEPCVATRDVCEQEPCAASGSGCEPEPCVSRLSPGCYPPDEHCVATTRYCDEPVVEDPEPDPVVEEPEPDEY
jgi:hypothetical protein